MPDKMRLVARRSWRCGRPVDKRSGPWDCIELERELALGVDCGLRASPAKKYDPETAKEVNAFDTRMRLNRTVKGSGDARSRVSSVAILSNQIGRNNMAHESIDYSMVLADLETKKSAIDAAMIAVRQILNLGADQQAGSAGAAIQRREQPTEIATDSFFGMTIPDAVKKCLTIVKRPMGLSEITKALSSGGLLSTSKDLAST